MDIRQRAADVDAVDVVRAIEGVRVRARRELHFPPFEEHDAHELAAGLSIGHALAEPVEVRLVPLRQIESRMSRDVVSRSRPKPRLGSRPHAARIEIRVVRKRPFPHPQAEEVLVVLVQEIEIVSVIERLVVRWIDVIHVQKVVPRVRAREVYRLAAVVREVAWVRRAHAQHAGDARGGAGRRYVLSSGRIVYAPQPERQGHDRHALCECVSHPWPRRRSVCRGSNILLAKLRLSKLSP